MMKQTIRLTVALVLLLSAVMCLPLGGVAAAEMSESVIEIKDNSKVVNTFEFGFDKADTGIGPVNKKYGNQVISSDSYTYYQNGNPISRYLYSDIVCLMPPGVDNVKMPASTTWAGDYYSFTYLANTQNNVYGESFMQIMTSNLLHKEEDLKAFQTQDSEHPFTLPEVVYDFATFEFGLNFVNLQSVFFVKLANTDTSYLALVVPFSQVNPADIPDLDKFPQPIPEHQREAYEEARQTREAYDAAKNRGDEYLLCLRKATTVGDAFYSKNDDIIIGSFGEGEWVDVRMDLHLQENTVGYFDYSVSMKRAGETEFTLLSDKGSMYHDSTMTDDASLANAGTKIFFSIPEFKATLAEDSVVSIDNLKLETFAYIADPVDMEADYPAVQRQTQTAFEKVWESTVNASDILNIRENMTILNTEYALQLPGVTGANYRDPFWQKKGAYDSDGYDITLGDDGSITVTKADGGNIVLPLYKSGNINLKADKIGAAYQIAFSFNYDGTNAPTMTLNGASLIVPTPVAQGWVDVLVNVDGTTVTVSCGAGNEAVTNGVDNSTAAPAFAIGLPAGKEISFNSFSLVEKTEIRKYYVTIGGQQVELNAARAKYLLFLQRTDETETALDYDTLERTGVRPVGTVYFDSDKFYYDPAITVSVRTWGTCISNSRCDITYWGTNKATPDEVTGEETNSMLNGKAYAELRDGAMVIGVNNVGAEHTYTYGFQSNLKKADGLIEMPGDYISDYFRYSFSIWYDPVTFVGCTDDDETRKFVLSMGERHALGSGVSGEAKKNFIGDNYLGGQIMLTIDYNGILTIPAPTYNHGYYTAYDVETNNKTALGEDIEITLEQGWNTISLVYQKQETYTGDEEVKGIDTETGTELVGTRQVKHAVFSVQLDINGDIIYHDKEDLVDGMKFYFDNGIDPTTEGTYLHGKATLLSLGNEKASELERISLRGIKVEACEDKVIDVNCYIKGTAGAEVLKHTDFSAHDGLTDPTVKANAAGAATFVNENDKLVVTHRQDSSVAHIGYFFDENVYDKHLTFDVSLFADFVGQTEEDYSTPMVFPAGGVKLYASADTGEKLLMSIDNQGQIYDQQGNLIGLCLERGWNNFSAVIEEIDGVAYLTLYIQGEILTFRQAIALEAITGFYVASEGNTGEAIKVDNLAVANDYVPTSIVYMMPVVYETFGGELSGGLFEDIHFIGQENTLFASAGKEAAEFVGWYYDEAFTAKANRVKASYSSPVVLYAKYNYKVSFAEKTATVYGYGNIELPAVSDVEYWRDDNGAYYKPGETYFVGEEVAFTPVLKTSADEKAVAEFVVKVNGIDAAGVYADIYLGVYGTEDEMGALALYNALTEQAKASADAVAAKAALDALIVILNQKAGAGDAYIAQFEIVKDATKSFDVRYNALLAMYDYKLDESIEQWIDRVDPTYRDSNNVLISEINGLISEYRTSFDNVNGYIVKLSDALYFYANPDAADAPWAGQTLTATQKLFLAANDVYLKLAECLEVDAQLIATYTITAEDYATMKDGTPKTYAQYVTEAEGIINGAYNSRFATFNADIYEGIAAINSVTYKLTDSLAVKVALDSIGKIIALPVYSGREDD